jgi:uncharacterized membrane protein YgcG
MKTGPSEIEGGPAEEMLGQISEMKISNSVEDSDSSEDSDRSEKRGLEAWDFFIYADESSRWSSTQRGLVRTSDFLGDHLAMAMREAARAGTVGSAFARCADSLMSELWDYEDNLMSGLGDYEPPLLTKLADTGRVVQAIARTIESALGLLHLRGSPEAEVWREQLRRERDQQVQQYWELLADEDRLRAALGNEQQHVEVQTLLKAGLAKYGALLTSGERDAMVAAFEASVQLSGIVVAAVPTWFAATKSEWPDATPSSIAGGGEACLRDVAVWSTLQHPNVRPFDAASHVGKEAFVLHQLAWELMDRRKCDRRVYWSHIVDCARGVLYVHERGLAHKNLTASHMMRLFNDTGVLSGLGLVPTDEDDSLQGDSGEREHQGPSRSNDVLRLGLHVFQLLVKDRAEGSGSGGSDSGSDASESGGSDGSEGSGGSELEPLPDSKPDFVDDDEWRLLQGMCAASPADRISMLDVVHQMADLADQEEDETSSDGEEPDADLETVGDVGQFKIASLDETLGGVLDDVASWCEAADPELAVVQRPVLDRLVDVYKQLLASPTPLSLDLVDEFSDIVYRFFVMLDGSEDNFSRSSVGALCASRTIAGRNYGFHYDIDRLLREHEDEGLESSAAVHRWQPSWKEVSQRQRQTLETLTEDPSSMLEELGTEAERSEALALLQSEAQSSGLRTAGTLTSLPEWFVPPHRVQLGKHIADGSFGAVYEGVYLGSPVVVKQVLTFGLEGEERCQFLHEADLWYSLSHRNLIQMYGACHEGRPFFVCERVMGGTIVERAKREENENTAWWMLACAAKGLEHLHEHGIVHGDLKGNNILVGEDSRHVKLADFGLSFTTDSSTAADGGALGAFRWKAPEVLTGGKATFASDIYSFGMCVIETVTGKLPWGNSILDAVVKHNVVERRLLPERPEEFTDKQWGVVTSMCCYDPEQRITAGAVVGMLLEVLAVLNDGWFDPINLNQY